MRKLSTILFLFLSINAFAQSRDTTKFSDADANPYNILVVVDGGVYKGTVESIDPQIIESINVLRGANSTITYRSKSIKGVIVVTTKGFKKQGGEGSEVSLSPANKPLIIVDDLIYRDEINTLNDKNILSVDVLKGANAIAIYGNTAANGVIVITTKQYYQIRIQNELSLKSKKYKQYIKRLDYLIVYTVNDLPLRGDNYEITKQIANIPEKDIVAVETKKVTYAGVDNVVVNIKTKLN